MTFEFVRLRLRFRAAGSLHFPPGKAGNVLRGALGMVLGQGLFAPTSLAGPSGLADPPRPFVLRAVHLDGCTIPRGSEFHFDVHLFDARDDARRQFVAAFAHWGARAELLSVERRSQTIDLDPPPEPAARVRVEFITPTELKSDGQLVARPEFAVAFARLRDRISALRALYGPGPLDIDFRGLGERAASVRLAACDLRWHITERRSSRTGQVHPLGGFTGLADFHGDLGEFLPYLRAGQFTGVGRQTVWGKGEIGLQVHSGPGLCATCKHTSVIRSDRGSVFYLCQLSATDPRFPKYPRLPVLTCPGYKRRA
jgi:CRISPR-associated endoribonuclease Cas6